MEAFLVLTTIISIAFVKVDDCEDSKYPGVLKLGTFCKLF